MTSFINPSTKPIRFYVDETRSVDLNKCNLRMLGRLFGQYRDSDLIFSVIYKKIINGMMAWLSPMCKIADDWIDQDEIDEVVGITFATAWEKRSMFNPELGEISTWLYRIARNVALSRQKSRQASPVISWDINDVYLSYLYSEKDIDDQMDNQIDNYVVDENGEVINCHNKEIIERFHDASVAAMDMLPDNYRAIVKSKLLQNKKIQDIATEYHLNVSTVKNWLYNGKRELCQYIQEHHGDLYDLYMEALQEEAAMEK